MKKIIVFNHGAAGDKPFLIIVILIFLTISIKGQEISSNVLCSAGETFTIPGNSLEYVLGEIATETFTVQGQKLTQGFLQGKQEGTSVDETFLKHSEVTVFPNPTTSRAVIRSNELPVRMELINMLGNTVYIDQHPQKTTSIDIASLPAGVYYLRVKFNRYKPMVKTIVKK